MKIIKHFFEFIFVVPIFIIFKIIGYKNATNLGEIIGKQGGTGSVQSYDGTIASIDFLAPAAPGSGSMTPYRNYDSLRRNIASQFQ